jgi:hypothetical protein
VITSISSEGGEIVIDIFTSSVTDIKKTMGRRPLHPKRCQWSEIQSMTLKDSFIFKDYFPIDE